MDSVLNPGNNYITTQKWVSQHSNKLVRVGGSHRIEKSGRFAIKQQQQAAVAYCWRLALDVPSPGWRIGCQEFPEMQEKIQSRSLGRGQV